MSTNTSAAQKVIPSQHGLLIGLIVLLAIVVTTGFVWMRTDHVIAPPGLRHLPMPCFSRNVEFLMRYIHNVPKDLLLSVKRSEP